MTDFTKCVSLPSDKSKLTSEDYARLGEEVLQSRREKQFSGQRLPYLPNFTGDGGTDLELYISAIESVKSTHSSQQIAQAIRRSVNGTAAKVINLLDYSATTTELVAELKKNFQRVTDTATTWQKFYAASQTSRESIMDWHIRVQHLYKMTGNRSNTDSHLKTKLYTGLFDKNLKRDVLFKYDDDNATEEDLYKLLLKRESDKSSSSISAPVVSAEDNTKKELEDLRNQLAAFKTSQKSKKKFTKEEDNHDVQLIEGEDSPSDTDENDDYCHCAYQVSRGHQDTYKRFDKQYRGERRYPQTGYSGRYEGNKSSEQQYYKQQYPRDNRRLNQYDDRRYNQSYDRPYNQSYDRPYNQSYDRQYKHTYDRPYNQHDDHRYDQNYERRYDQSYGSQHAHHDRRYSQYYTDQPHNYGYQREDVQQSYGDPYSGQRYNSNNDGGANDGRPYYYNNHYQSKYNERSEEGRARQDFHDNKVHREDEHLMEGHQTSNGNRQHQPSHSDNSKSHEQRQKKKIHVSAPAKNKKKKSKDYTSIQRRLIGRTNTDTIEVNGLECTALIDSGSVISSMSSKFHEQQFSHIPLKPIEDVFPDGLSITSATDHELNISGYLEVNVLLPGLVTPVPILMTVLKSSILCGDMPILIGSNALESWRLELDSNKNTRDVNPVVDRWKSEPNCVGIVKNVNYAQIQSHNCLFIQSKVKVNDIRPYNRKLLFVPFEKYANTISPSTISVPKNTENISCELVTLPTKSTQCIRVPAGKKIGIMCPLKEEVLIPVNQQYNVNSSERGEELIKSFNKTSWPTELSTEIENLITDYQDVFALSHHELGCFTDAKHRIELTDRTPIKQKYRRIPPHLFEAVKTEIQKMLENGVIRPSISPYSSPLSIAIKKDGTPRICLDFRKINNITKNDAKAIPSVDEMIDLLHGKTTFSSLDLVQGFHQQELEESSKQFTAFNAGPLGLFEYQRLPFGIKNASASFQRMMEYVLSDLLPSTCLVYIDDVIVHSYTQAEHLQSLRKVFECLRFYNLKLKPSKCEFFKTELKFLGHIISDKGLKADPDKITAIKDWPQPKSVKQIRQFLGLSGFLRRYIKDYAIIARPITDLLQGYSNKKQSRSSNLKLEKEHFVWGKDQQAAFNKLKQVIAKDVTLAFPNFNLPFKLSCDASRNGLGGWLEQVQPNGKYRPIAFASRKTSNAERQYPVHKIEFLALKWCVTEKFKDYLYGKSFVIYTDNNPLTYVLKSAKLDATSQRWLSQLEQYDFTIEYKPGVNNIVADALSRIYDTEEDDNIEHVQKWAQERSRGFEDNTALPIASTTVLDTIDYHPTVNFNWHTLQSTDHTIATVKKKISKQQLEESDNSHEVKQLLKYEQQLTVHKDLLYIRNAVDQQLRLVVPKPQHQEIVRIYHSFGHFGITRTYKTLKVKFFWINMKQNVIETISECERCQKAKTPATKNKGPLNHLITPKYPFHQLSIDYVSIDTRAKTKFKILTCIDEFTKFAFAIPVKSENAKRCAEVLYQQIYTKFGIPTIIHSDRGATFMSNILKELNTILNIKHTVTTAYRPQSNGTCERLNSTIINRIRTLAPGEKPRWNLHLDSLICAYNSTTHESIGMSPFYAMYGRQPIIPVDLLVRLPEVEDDDVKPNTFAERRVKELKQSYELMAKNMDKRRVRSKRNYDDRLKKTTLTFNVGDHVLIRKFIRNNKVDDRFQAEINEVLKQKEDLPLYLVKGLESGTIKTIHRDNLILFKQHSTTNSDQDFDTIETWTNTRHKIYKPKDDEEFPIKKSFNGRISIHFGKLLLPTDVASIKVETSTSIEDIQYNLKSLRKDSAEKCVIYIDHDHPGLIGQLLTAIRNEFHHSTWKKVVVSTKKHTIYNSLIKEMCTYFPNTPKLRQETEFSESDDNSDDEYIVVQPDINDDANNETHEGTDDDEPNSTDDDEVQPRYNLRPHRNRPAYLKDYVTFTFTPNQ